MGQRLNIEIVNNEGLLANAYYHWDAYTDVALNDTKIIIDAFYSEEMQKLKKDPLALAIALLEKTGAGINKEEQEKIANDETLKQYSFNPCSNRDKGLLSVTKEGMKETRDWEEGRVTINIDEETVFFDVLYEDSQSDYLYFREEEDLNNLPKITDLHVNISAFSFDEIENAIKFVDEHPNGYIDEYGDVVYWINL